MGHHADSTSPRALSFSLPEGVAIADLLLPAALTADPDARGRIELRSAQPLPLLAALAGWAASRGLDLPDLSGGRPTLEDAYLKLTQGGAQWSRPTCAC